MTANYLRNDFDVVGYRKEMLRFGLAATTTWKVKCTWSHAFLKDKFFNCKLDLMAIMVCLSGVVASPSTRYSNSNKSFEHNAVPIHKNSGDKKF